MLPCPSPITLTIAPRVLFYGISNPYELCNPKFVLYTHIHTHHLYVNGLEVTLFLNEPVAQSAGTVEYTDCTSAEG